MTVKFRLNGEHIAYIDKELLESYREVLRIPKKRKDSRVLRDIMYKEVLGTDYYTDEVKDWVDTITTRAKFNRFKNVGEFMEYYMHKAIEDRLDICKNCNKYREGFCLEDDREVADTQIGCDSRPFVFPQEEDEFLRKLKEESAEIARKERENHEI